MLSAPHAIGSVIRAPTRDAPSPTRPPAPPPINIAPTARKHCPHPLQSPAPQFPAYVAGLEYMTGDYWTFRAFFIDVHNLNQSPEIQLGTVKPGVLKRARSSSSPPWGGHGAEAEQRRSGGEAGAERRGSGGGADTVQTGLTGMPLSVRSVSALYPFCIRSESVRSASALHPLHVGPLPTPCLPPVCSMTALCPPYVRPMSALCPLHVRR